MEDKAPMEFDSKEQLAAALKPFLADPYFRVVINKSGVPDEVIAELKEAFTEEEWGKITWEDKSDGQRSECVR